jgi:hypothetical protein
MVPSRLWGSVHLGAAVIAALFTLTVAGAASATMSGASNSTTGATCSGGGSGDGDCRNSVSFTVPNNGTTFTSRYAWNINADTGVFSTHDTSGNAQHNISFSASAVGGYSLTVSQVFSGDMNRVSDLVGCDGAADVSGVSGSQSGGTLQSGTLSVADPGSVGNGGSTTEIPFSSSASATITRVSNGVSGTHNLTFTWNGSVRSNSCEAAVRLGESSGTTSGCSACGYPGSPGRAASTDGQFVTVTFTSLCGNGVVDASVGEQCDQGGANGTAGSCCTSTCQFKTGGTSCRPAAGVCDLEEFCSGMSGACPFDFKKPNGSGCRAIAGQCDQPELCDGVSNDCPPDTFLPNTTVCRAGSSGEVCDQTEFCTGSGPNCPPDLVQPNTVVCRSSAGVCDVTENCDGTNKFCPSNAFVPNTVVCRSAAGFCDVAENCPGNAANCPADAFKSATTVCRASAGTCDITETCPGNAANCPADSKSTALCRASAGFCDVAENCDGVNNACPPDAFKSFTIVCRASAGVCDIAENCTGFGAQCPPNAFEPSSTECRASAGVCDPAENCSGSTANCPSDAKSTAVCRASAGVCDLVESCDGTNNNCPADAKSTVVCRAAVSACDVTESCNGTNDDCPADSQQPSGTACSDGFFCNGLETCDGAGTCNPGSPPCPIICDEANDQCLFSGCPVAPEPGCLTAQKSIVSIKNKADNTKDKLIWKWVNGQSASQSDFSDPLFTANYALCIYTGTTAALTAEMDVPPSSTLWHGLSSKGYKYFDPSASQDGAQKIILKGSSSNKSKILVKGRGTALPDPIDVNPMDLPVKVQLINHQTVKCFESNFNGAVKNTLQMFKAKSP